MTVISEDVSKWIAREMSDITEEGTISRIELHHTIEGEGGERLKVFRNLSDLTADSLSDDVWAIAEKDAQTRAHDMPQRYVLMSFRGEEEGEPEAMHAFIIKGSVLSTVFGSSTDPPTAAGRQAQDMRHSESMHRLMVTFAEGTAGRLARDLERENRMRIAAEETNRKMMETYQTLLDRQQERDLERAEATQRAKQMDSLMGTVLSLGTLMAAKYLGAPAAPGSLPPGQTPPSTPGSSSPAPSRSAALGVLLSKLTQEEGMGIFGALKSQNKLVVQELYTSFKEFPPASNTFVDAGRDLAIAKFFQGLDAEELTGIWSVLSRENLDTFKAIYASYEASYAAEQKAKPGPLRDDPNPGSN